MFKKSILSVAASTAIAFSFQASATQMDITEIRDMEYNPVIHAGYPPGFGPGDGDTPDDRVDPNTTDSPFSGIVSLYINRQGAGYICSGTLISPWHVVTAAHCIDSNGQGQTIDLNDPNNDVAVVFNDDGTYSEDPAGSIRWANQVSMHPDYQGFNVCPDGSSGCVNDDVAVVRIGQPAPSTAAIIPMYEGQIGAGTELTLVGYGTSGDGVEGDYLSPDYGIKRVGANITDLFAGDDEGGNEFDVDNYFNAEVWYADFDGYDEYYDSIDDPRFPDGMVDAFCYYVGVCSETLGNEVETNIGGGDSGGASLVLIDGQYYLVGNNTFGSSGLSPLAEDFGISGGFGSHFGGMLLNSYLGWINQVAVPTPGIAALFGLGLLALGRRRS